MWRYALAFLICSLTAAFAWIAVFPLHGALEDSQRVLWGSAGVLLLGFEVFMGGIVDQPRLKQFITADLRHGILALFTGAGVGTLSGLTLVPAARHWENSLLIVLIPMALYLLGYLGLSIAADRRLDEP